MSARRRLALIPARGGSRRLPRKNIVDFAGKPMLVWAVEAAKGSNLFDDVVVSTDDEEIAKVAAGCGAAVLRRGPELSNDASTLIQVVDDFLGRWPDSAGLLCLLPPNCPLRTGDDIVSGHDHLTSRGSPAVLSVVSYGWTPPFRAFLLDSRKLIPVFPDWIGRKSQTYPDAVCASGAVLWARTEAIAGADDLYVNGIEGFVIPWHRAIDIDTVEDYELALCIRHALDAGFEFGS